MLSEHYKFLKYTPIKWTFRNLSKTLKSLILYRMKLFTGKNLGRWSKKARTETEIFGTLLIEGEDHLVASFGGKQDPNLQGLDLVI